MSLIDQLISTLVPHDCVGCGYEGQLICNNCSTTLRAVPPRCYQCRRLSPAFRTCTDCRWATKLQAVYVATTYNGVAKDLLWQLKFQGAQAAAATAAKYMLPLLPTTERAYLVPVPTATLRIRSRGYDQAKLLARALARRGGLPYLDSLRRSGQTHQVGASRQSRLQQLNAAFHVKRNRLLNDQKIILIDDVITTGATLEAAAAALQAAGAQSTSALVFAQPDL